MCEIRPNHPAEDQHSPPIVERSTIEAVLGPLAQAWPPDCWRDVTTIAAVSGGPDSVALLRAMLALRRPGAGRVIVAHFNHRLRGQESDDDERFVRHLADQWELACEIGRADVPDQHPKPTDRLGSEEAARIDRYAFLTEAAARQGARYVATGHTADDQAETLLHRLVRGTGIRGLAGIQRHRQLLHGVSLVRPFLQVRRGMLIEYLAVLGQDYRQDSSNQHPQFTRNRIRHDLIPRLESEYNAELTPALGRLATLADEVQQWLEQQASEWLSASALRDSWDQAGPVDLDCRVLRQVRPLLVREMFVQIWKSRNWPRQAMTFEKWNQLARMVHQGVHDSQRCQSIFPGGIIARRTGDRLTLDKPDQPL
ncbi:MAG: tRNA lysidine(34) synthetase TilS [Planctomycetaceae bacterium]|nr:MAG: tRNA lysidine(34) synthetase TilS [Planctomycetaceae bacterium]